MPTYTHTYTRDTSIIIQEAWFRAHTMGLGKIFDWVNPYPVPTVYVVSDGVVEVWDDEEAYAWIRDQLQKEVVKRPAMIGELIERYEGRLRILDALVARGCPKDAKAFLDYLELLLDAVIHFIIIYHVAAHEQMPSLAHEAAMHVRQKDTLFDMHDKIIRACLQSTYPELQGCETVIRYREVKYNQVADRSELEKRKQGWVVVPGETYELGSLEVFQQKYPKYWFEIETLPMVSELNGQIAFSGKVRGRVRIIKRKDQVGEVVDGDILLSPMTTPDFLPAMQRAAAFVTDEGGITCHAAIVARELQKPCLIGTKRATKTFMDGDLVEVDANQGIIKKIAHSG